MKSIDAWNTAFINKARGVCEVLRKNFKNRVSILDIDYGIGIVFEKLIPQLHQKGKPYNNLPLVTVKIMALYSRWGFLSGSFPDVIPHTWRETHIQRLFLFCALRRLRRRGMEMPSPEIGEKLSVEEVTQWIRKIKLSIPPEEWNNFMVEIIDDTATLLFQWILPMIALAKGKRASRLFENVEEELKKYYVEGIEKIGERLHELTRTGEIINVFYELTMIRDPINKKLDRLNTIDVLDIINKLLKSSKKEVLNRLRRKGELLYEKKISLNKVSSDVLLSGVKKKSRRYKFSLKQEEDVLVPSVTEERAKKKKFQEFKRSLEDKARERFRDDRVKIMCQILRLMVESAYTKSDVSEIAKELQKSEKTIRRALSSLKEISIKTLKGKGYSDRLINKLSNS